MRSMSFLVTDKCNVKCDFCAPNCGPDENGYLSEIEMIKIYDDVSVFHQVPLIVFSGGEPMLYWKKLRKVMEHIQHSEPSTRIRIVTNGSWAITQEKAEHIVSKLHEAGLSEFNISVDDFHQKYVPFERVKYAIYAAHKFDIPVLLAHKTYPGSISSRSFYEKELECDIPDIDEIESSDFDGPKIVITTGYTVPTGRGAEHVNSEEWVPIEYIDSPRYNEDNIMRPCTEVLNSYTINADSTLAPCCGLVSRDLQIFRSGNVVENNAVDIMEKSSKSIIYNWLALEGVGAIRDYVNSIEPVFNPSKRYVQACQLCQELFSNKEALRIIYKNIEHIGSMLSAKRCLHDAFTMSTKITHNNNMHSGS